MDTMFRVGWSLLVLAVSGHAQISEGLNDQALLAYLQPDAAAPAPANGALEHLRRCDRACVAGAEPRLCYYKFKMEDYHVLGPACGLCPLVPADCQLPQCVTADGYERGFLAANRRLPGPAIQVCVGDRIVVDVLNTMPARSTTLHFHGVFQHGTNSMDGVPMVTQCPIPEDTTFRYDFVAGNAGTHFWHSHDGFQKMDGLQGHLIVREPKSLDPNKDLYDDDLGEHALLLTDWFETGSDQKFPGLRVVQPGQEPVSYLINGRGRLPDLRSRSTKQKKQKKPPPSEGGASGASYRATMLGIYARHAYRCTPLGEGGAPSSPHPVPLTNVKVRAGRRYRIRLVGGTCAHCPAVLAVERHRMRVIATDGNAVLPVDVDELVVLPGERYDFVLEATQPEAAYWITVRGLGPCVDRRTFGLAVLRYEGSPHEAPRSPEPSYDSLPKGREKDVTLNPVGARCGGEDGVCVTQLELAAPHDPRLATPTPDVRLHFDFDFHEVTADGRFFREGNFHRFLQPAGFAAVSAQMNNMSNTMAASPLLGQYDDIPPRQFCPEDGCPGGFCECLHLVRIPLGALVEMAIADGMADVNPLTHPFHLHGHKFHVLALRAFASPPEMRAQRGWEVGNASVDALSSRQPDQPWFVAKDTVAVPSAGFAVVRFIADNPGFWLFHCHFNYHHVIGMSVVLQVGERDQMPAPPPGAPTCGNYVPTVDPAPYA